MLAAGHPTLGSFNNGSKLTDETLALWSRLLAAIPDARLLIVGVPDGSAQARVRAAIGAAADRVRIAARLDRDAFRQAAATIDIALDPRPFSGATTTLEMLWQGVPVVTWPGATSPSRSTASLNSALGLADWIARDENDYIAIVTRALADPAALENLRRELPARLRTSPLCDAAAFTRRLEAALLDGWRTMVRAQERLGRRFPIRRSRVVAGGRRFPMASGRRCAARDDRSGAAVARRCRCARRGAHARSTIYPNGRPRTRAYLQVLLAWSRGEPDIVARAFPPPPARSRPPRVSVVICSIDPRKFATVTSSYRQRFAGCPLQIIGVHDATSLAEAYNRAAATGDRRPHRVLARRHRARHARISRRGSSRISTVTTASASPARRASPGPKWGHAGQRHIHGHILHVPPPSAPGVLLMASGFQAAGVREHPCARWRIHRGAAARLGDRTASTPSATTAFISTISISRGRASAAGARLAVPLDLTLLHRSTGRYDAAWRRYAARFVAQVGPRSACAAHPRRPAGATRHAATGRRPARRDAALPLWCAGRRLDGGGDRATQLDRGRLAPHVRRARRRAGPRAPLRSRARWRRRRPHVQGGRASARPTRSGRSDWRSPSRRCRAPSRAPARTATDNRARGLMFADGAMPIVPQTAGPRSDRMSPNRFEPTTTSKRSG